MDIHWEVHWQETRRGRSPVFRFDPVHKILGTLLVADVQRNVRRLRQAVERVRNGEEASSEVGGNVCTVMVGRERVLVLDALAPDGIGKACAVDVDEFGRILDAWEMALQQAEEPS